MTSSTAWDPRTKLRAISKNAKQLWTVIYVETVDTLATVERDVEGSIEGGADAVVLEISKDPSPLRRAIAHVRTKYPSAAVGVNYLGDDKDPYGYVNGFQIAKDYDLPIVWTDFSGVDLVEEVPETSLHLIERLRPRKAFYCSGIHMKYGTLLDPNKPIEQSAQQAMGWVDGIIVTGQRTGMPTDPEQTKKTRHAIGSYPLGAASGVTADNFASIRDNIDFCLVNSSIADTNHRIIGSKVRALRQAMA